MASILKRKNGRKAIQICCPDGRRPTINLGKVDMETARDTKQIIERIASRKWSGLEPTVPQVDWLNSLPESFYERLAKVGIVDARESETEPEEPTSEPLGKFVQDYIDKRTELKASTKEQYGYTRRLLVEYFGCDREIHTITRADAKHWQRWMRRYIWKPATEESPAITLADATVSKHTKRARTIFTEAVDARLIDDNPMLAIKGGDESNRERKFNVTPSQAKLFLDKCPDHLYRLAFALARYGGLRSCEVSVLEWRDIDFDELTIRSPKTGIRKIPIFEELRPYLDEAFDRAPEGQRYCIGHLATTKNLGTLMRKKIVQAGLEPYCKPMQNLRDSRENELKKSYTIDVFCKWLGHSPKTALKYYLQASEEELQEAAKSAAVGAAKSGAAGAGMVQQEAAN